MRLQKLIFLFPVLLAMLFTSCSDDKGVKLCTDDMVAELVSTRFGEEHDAYKIWHKLKKHGHISEKHSNDVRVNFVNMQFIFESTLASMLKYKQASKVIAVIYTPTPSTPLRTDGTNISSLLPVESLEDPNILNTVVSRYESLHEYLGNGGILYSVYKNTTNESAIPGFNFYRDNLQKYPKHLIDMPVASFEKEFSGASYIIECENGERVFFSISSTQISDIETERNWELYYGSLSDEKIHTHFKMLKDLYKKYGIHFDVE